MQTQGKVDEQNSALESLRRAGQRASAALAAAERRHGTERRANTLAAAAPTKPEKLCESIDVSSTVTSRRQESSGAK
jgi:hypothetical protein